MVVVLLVVAVAVVDNLSQCLFGCLSHCFLFLCPSEGPSVGTEYLLAGKSSSADITCWRGGLLCIRRPRRTLPGGGRVGYCVVFAARVGHY